MSGDIGPPDYVDELQNALDQLDSEDTFGAVRTVENVLGRHRDLAVAIHVLGLAAYKMEEPGRARELLETAHRLDPACMETADSLAILYARIGRLSDCAYYGKLATALQPHPFVKGLIPNWYGTFEEAFLSISESRFGKSGDQMMRAGDLGGATEMFRKEAESQPNEPEPLRRYARALLSDEKPYDALIAFQQLGRFAVLTPDDDLSIASALSKIGRRDDAARIADGLVSDGALDADTASMILGDMAEDVSMTPGRLADAEAGWAEAFRPRQPASGGRGAVDVGAFKIGFVTGRAHSRGGLEFLWPLMSALVARRIAVHVYSLRSVEDPIGRRLRGTVASWVDAADIDNDTLCTIIRNDGIHVLIDIDGHTGSGRPALYLHRPAPLAFRLMGLPASAEVQGFDGVLGDAWLYPGAGDGIEPQALIHRVDGGVFRLPGVDAEADPDEAGDDDPLAGVFDRMGTTIGVTASRRDMTPETWAILKDIAAAHEDVRFLISGRRVGGHHGINDLVETAADLGLDDTLDFTEDSPSADARAFVSDVDLLLLPAGPAWSGALAEAVSSGKPAVAVSSDLPVNRVAMSVLGGLGMSKFIAATKDDAVGLVLRLCEDPEERQKIGAEMRANAGGEGYAAAVQAWAEAFSTTLIGAYERKKSA